MAPLGLLTAVVSVIRVCGSASLRAFIGRAQESSGVAEIEVLSCTSATTGELFNARGGIARVFGTPQILEVVVTKPNDPDKPEFEVKTLQKAESWAEVKPGQGRVLGVNKQWTAESNEESEALLESLECQPNHRSPNLSLNVGIARIPQVVTYLAATFGMVLQTGVLIFAILTTHPKFVHQFTDSEESGSRPSYGLPFTLTGTILVCTGMFFCAYIIEQCTEEVVYKRSKKQPSKVYWVQPGNQKIGDQVFDSFIRESDEYENLPRYIISTRSHKKSNRPILLGIALISSLVGFVLQFVGLRALHSSVIFAQLGATLLMSIIRAMLRMKRSDDASNTVFSKAPKENRDQPSMNPEPGIELETTNSEKIDPEMIEPWREKPEVLHGHELDLLAMKICKVDMVFLGAAEGAKIVFGIDWTETQKVHLNRCAELANIEYHNLEPSTHNLLKSEPGPVLEFVPEIVPELLSQPELEPVTDQEPDSEPESKESESESESELKMEGVPALRPQVLLAVREISLEGPQDDALLDVRRQLAQLAKWPNFEVRNVASSLKSAIDGTLEVISPTINALSGKNECFWPVFARSITFEIPRKQETKNIKMKLTKSEGTSLWQADREELEALVGLWALSIHRGNCLEGKELQKARGLIDHLPNGPNPRPRPHKFYEESVRLLFTLDGGNDTSTTAEQRISSAKRWCNIWVTRRSRVTEKFRYIPDEDKREPLYGNNWAGTHVFGYSKGRGTFPGHSLVAQISNNSLFDSSSIRLCAHDIFCFFLEALVRAIDGIDIGGITEVRPIVNQEDIVLFQNTIVEGIADLFQSSGLGTREDAYLCIFPVLLKTNKMPSASGIVTAVIDRAEAYRSQGQWSKAFEILEWLCYDYLQPTPYKAANLQLNSPCAETSLGDLCYAAIREKDDDVIRLGFESIRRMLQSDIDPRFSRQYGQIGLQICKDHDSLVFQRYRSLLQNACTNLKSFVEIYGDLELQNPNRLACWAERGQTAVIRYILGQGANSADVLNGIYDREHRKGRTAIHYAVDDENIEMVRVLLNAGVSIEVWDRRGMSPSYIAADNGHSKILEMLIRYDLNAVRITAINLHRHFGGFSLLMAAVAGDHIKCVEQILKALPLSVNLRSHNGDNALGVACRDSRENSAAVISTLLEHGCDARNQNRDGGTALHIAVERAFELAVSLILSSGAVIDINAQNSEGDTSLHLAMSSGSKDIVKLLVKAGANPTIRNKTGDTALLTAIKAGLPSSHENVEALFCSGIWIFGGKFDESISEAFVAAAFQNHSEIVEFFLENTYDTNLTYSASFFKKALQDCEHGNNVVESAMILKQLGRSVKWGNIRESKDPNKAPQLPTCLVAADEGSTELLSLNQDGYVVYYNSKDRDGKTALHFASAYGILWLISELVQKGASPLACDDFQRVSLHYIGDWMPIETSEDEISSMLELLCGGVPGRRIFDYHDKEKQTPLYRVIDRYWRGDSVRDRGYNRSQERLAKRLLEMGANPNGLKGGPCPLEAATRLNKVEMVQLLLKEYRADVNYRLEGFPTLLHQVVADTWVDIRIMGILLEYKADVNATLENRVTPLTYAFSIWHHTDTESSYEDFTGSKKLFEKIESLLSYGAHVTEINYCHKCALGEGLLGEFIDDLLSPQKSDLVCRTDEKLPRIIKLLLAAWKNKNPEKVKEDAMKELGGKVVWSGGGVWEDYEGINFCALGILPKSLFETSSEIEPPDQNIEGNP
ncbi:hypothetical protein TWF506_007850 [Arthrobotrys conoides]|uniref:Ankyrin repeat protein n=1 Tax=Arthrobotrys conoides TaxID=74498 RepID=A0AAN8RZY2_9PEZI